MDKAREILRRWEAIDDPPGQATISDARRDISFLYVELELAHNILSLLAGAHSSSHLNAVREAACAYISELAG